MKKYFKLIMIILLAGSLVFTFSGCNDDDDDDDYERKSKNKNDVNVINKVDDNNNETNTSNVNSNTNSVETPVSSATVKDGIYYMVLKSDDVELSAGDVCLEIKNGKISIGDGISGTAETGTYEIKGNNIVGYYDTIKYIDHANGGEMAEDSTSEEFDFDILEDGSLRDNYGYGSYFGNKVFAGRIYRLVTEY